MALEPSSDSRSPREIFLGLTVVCCIIVSTSPNTRTVAMPIKYTIEEKIPEPEVTRHHWHRHTRAVNVTKCVRPTEKDLDTLFQQMISQLHILTQFLQPAINEEAISIPAGERWTRVSVDANDNPTCPQTLTHQGAAPLSERSLCPYYFDVLHLPHGYYPPTLKTARCKCQRCVQLSGFGCEAVPAHVTVLKPMGCFRGMQKFKQEMVTVNTGFVCAYRGHDTRELPTTTTTTTTTSSTSTANASWGLDSH